MRHAQIQVLRRLSGNRGQSLAEYAMILMLVASVCVAAAALLGLNTAGFFAAFAGNV